MHLRWLRDAVVVGVLPKEKMASAEFILDNLD
jgi:hypothetical protein